MIDLIKKAMFTGIGVASLTKDKVEDLAQEFIEKGKLSESEGKTLVEDLLAKSDESKDCLKKQIESVVNTTVDSLGLAKGDEIRALKEEIAELRAKLDATAD